MNIELIKKYKAEFNYWLNGGSVLLGIRDSITSIIKWYPSVTDPFEEESTSRELLVIINDDYCTYRKALVEGKIVEFRHEKMGFEDWTIVNKDHIFQNVVKGREYRIKPEEPKFKIGDFVRDIISGKVSQVNNEDIANGKYSQVTKWEPFPRELCWFWSGNKLEEATLSKFHSYTKNGVFKTIYDSFKYCEPFLNSKPSWFE